MSLDLPSKMLLYLGQSFIKSSDEHFISLEKKKKPNVSNRHSIKMKCVCCHRKQMPLKDRQIPEEQDVVTCNWNDRKNEKVR